MNRLFLHPQNAKVAQLVERDLAKVEVAGSNPVFRSKLESTSGAFKFYRDAWVVELVDTQDLKSCEQKRSCGFDSHPRYIIDEKPSSLLEGFFVFSPPSKINPCFLRPLRL
jgi:hypothetical protein